MTTTIDLGIDLGTTNSVVAISRSGNIEIVKNRNAEITPSMVAYDQRGTEKVGQQARASYGDPRRGPDVQAEFKRKMGQDVQLHFANCDVSKSPEELSAIVLQDLRRAAEERFGTSPRGAVVTVPAMFELPQNEATARAARLAGFDHSQLLQEPVAAAVAYGMSTESEKALWLVYDFGGGTFDTSLISIRDGALTVVRHAGDNYLGGADFDWAIVDHILLPKIAQKFNIGSLKRHSADDRQSIGRLRRLKAIAEDIKIELSRSDSSELYREAGDVFEDDTGAPVELDLSVSRGEFERLIRDSVSKSVQITRELIRASGYGPGDVEKVVLVGGTTFVPMVREQVGTLGIPTSFELDPMTVVARGAAVFASTQVMPEAEGAGAAVVASGQASVNLEFERITKQATPLVGGRVSTPDGLNATDCRLTITRDDNGFTSGNLALDATGMFFTNVQIRDSGQSSFRLELRGPDGELVPVTPSEFAITHGLTVGKATLPSGCQVALADGSAKMLVSAGTTLPADGHHDLRTSRDLKAGSDDSLVIPFLSGDAPRADHNRVGTMIHIHGAQIRRDLPKGSKVEASVRVDESGVPHPLVYIERLDQEFVPQERGRNTVLEHEPPEVMRQRLAAARAKVTAVAEKASQGDAQEVLEEVQKLEVSSQEDRIEQLIHAWEAGDDVAAGKARNELASLATEVDRLDTLVDWPAKLAEFEKESAKVKELLAELGQTDLNEAIDTVIIEGQRAVKAHDPKMLEASITMLHQIRMMGLQRDPRFWAGMLQFCAERIGEFPDQVKARELMAEGAGAMRRGDVDSLESVCRELIQELPAELAAEAQGAAIRSDVM
ncbi:MAG: Hsp70 family protein [Phycisphaeraceae bacterium]